MKNQFVQRVEWLQKGSLGAAVITDGQPTVSRRSTDSQSRRNYDVNPLSHYNHPTLTRAMRYAAVVLMVLMVGVGNVWGANGDELFSQDFSSATAVAYTENTARAYTSSNYNICGTTAASQFTTITCNNKVSAGIGINSASGGNGKSYSDKFGVYANNTSFYWSICKTSNFASTAPTAIKVEFNAAFAHVSSGSNTGVQIAVGSSFSSGLTNSCPALSNCVAGFAWPSNSTIRIAKYAASNGNTAINGSSSTLTGGTSYKYTWVINNTASTLTYTGPDNKSTTVAAGCWDLWVGTTRNLAGVTKATTGMSGTTIQNLYIGSPFGKKHEFILDDITVTDLTPGAACTAPDHVNVTGRWDRFAGETINLTATAYDGSDAEIADANITGWQWQKLEGSTWTNVSNGTVSDATTSGATTKNLQITNCGAGNSGKYRCVVSTGATCSTASATATDGSQGFGVKVYVLECYNGGTTEHHFTRTGDSQAGTLTMTLTANTAYTFKVHADNTYYGNNGTINKDEANWVMCNSDNGGDCTNNLTVNSGLGGTFTFGIEYSTGGNSSQEGEPELSVTYPRKTMYLVPNSDWLSNSAKFAFYYYGTSGTGWTDFLTSNDCGMSADIPQWNGLNVIAVRFNSSEASPGWNGDGHVWNQTGDITATADKNCVTITDWNAGTYGTYATPTYTISYNAGTGGSGSRSDETKTCGVAFTLPNSAVFTRTGYTQTGWTTSDGGVQTHALGGTYTANAAQTFYPVWTVNNYDLTWNLDGGTTTSAGTGIASGVSSNTTSSVAYGTSLTAPTVTKTGYNFSAWSPSVASTMPAANTAYTATWTLKTTTITINANTANHGSTTPGTVTATYGSTLPSFTAASGASGYSLTGYFTAATGGTKIINADGTLVASTSYADGSGNWNSEAATLTLYAQYEEEAGEDCTNGYNSPSTTTYATKTFLDVSATNYNTSASTNYYLTYSAYWMHNTYKTWTWWNSNDAGSNKDASTYTYANAESEGYLATASSASGNNGYGGKKIHLTRRDSIWFTGATSVACLNKGSNSAIFTMEVFQVASNGTLSKVGSSYTNATTSVTSLVCSSLNASNYYLVKFYATAASNTSLYQVRFGNACASAPSCTAVAAPTSLTCSAQTSSSLTFTWTKASNASTYTAKLYSDAGCESQVASQDLGDVATVTFSTLSASTTYYCKVQSHGDGSTYCAAGGTTSAASGTTSAAPASALITYNLNVGTSASTTIKSSTSTTDGTNITNIDIDQTNDGANGAGASDRTTKLALATGTTASAVAEPDKYEVFTFKVACGKKVTPSEVKIKVANVGSSAGGNQNYKAVLSDTYGHSISNTFTGTKGDGTVEEFSITNGSSVYFQGVVTLKLWSCKGSGGNASAFRMGTPLEIYGEVANQATPAATITWTTQPANGQVGDPDFAYAVSCSDGSAVTVTSANTTYATIVGGKLHYAAAGTTHLVATATDACGNVLTPVNSNDFTVTVPVTYSITYHCNGAESGCPSDVAATTNLPSPLPTGMTKDGYDFGGWFTDSECTVAAVAGAALTGNTDLYAKWTERGSECEDTPHAWDVIATSAKSYKVRISKVTEDVAIPVADATASNLTAYAGTSSTSDNVTVQIADGGSSKYGYKFDGSNTYLKLVFSTPLVLNDTLVVGMTNASHNISFTTTAVRSTTLSTSGGKLIIPAALAGQSTLYLWRGSGTTMYLRSFAVKHECEAIPSCTTPTLPTATLSNQTVCEGSDIAAWDATPTNASTITGKSESISYSWKKKGNDTELATTATFDLGSSAAESQAGTYVVTVTVSKAGYASSSANKEVDLTVTEGEEVTSITADKATVYPGNSVTLTATANITPDSWQWYTCTSAEGADEAIISGAESASYTIASAGAAGTYYYKAKATGDCGTAEAVYTLVVSPAAGGDCFHFVSVIPASDFNASSGASLVTPTHATTLEGGTMKVGSQQVTFTKDYGLKMEGTKTVSITLDAALEAGNVVIVKGTSGSKGYGITINGVNFYDADNKTFDVSYTVLADDGLEGQTALTVSKYSGNSYLQEVKITGCGESCTDPEVTASADNTTACVGTSVTFTATGAHAEATYQWQKLDGTWTNISGATKSTYTFASVVAGDAGKYRVIASHDCNRTSNEVTLSVPTLPNFGSTVPASVSVMQTIALSINTVEATDAVKYRWYKSADPTWDAGDVEIGTNKELIKAYDGEAIGSPSYYIFCRAQNACGITTSTAIAVYVTTYVEEDCATRGNESDAAFSFENSGCGQGSYESTACWTMNSNSKILVYYPPTGKYFKTAKVTIASSSESKASYNWSTNGGTSFTAVSLTVNSTLTERTIELSAHGNVDAFQIGRNFNSTGESSGTLYVSKICFEYTDACTATTVTPSTSSVDYEMGGEWSNPTFTLTPAAVSGETLTYSSSNEDIASVDDDGTVTFNGDAGTVTITASYAGGEVSSTQYCASQGSYTINVSCPGGAPKVVADGSTDMSGCNSSVTLHAKTQAGGDFADGSYQWFRNGEEIDGATNKSYTATQAGTYTVERTNAGGCTTPSTNSAIVTSETTEPEVERLVPFQYYHVDKTYSDQMKMRHLFAVKNSGKLDGKSFKMYVSRNGSAATDVTSSAALEVWPNGDGHVDTVMVDLNKLSGKYSENDELVFTCKAIDCSGNVSDVYKETITMNVIGATPTLALICSGSSKAGGTRKTGELTVGGDFLTGYNVADLCQQTGNTSFDANTEWGLYTDLKTQYIVTPVNGYAVFNKLNYEPFDILLLTDYPKASKSDAAKDVLDDMAALCDYRPMLSFKTHMVAKSPSKWAEKGFTTSPVVTKADGRLNLNIVCYAHPMFEGLKSGEDVYEDANNTSAPLVYTMLSGTGYESSKGMQGFELAAAENFVTIGLTHYNGTITKNSPDPGEVEWTPGSEDRMLVTVAERQTNIEARFILFSLNCGAQSKLTDRGEQVILACLEYLLDDNPLHVADCSFTFDNGASNEHDAAWYSEHCNTCTGTKGDGKWTTAANWGPDYRLLPGEFTSVRIKKPVEVNDEHAHVMEVRLIDEGSIDIPAGKALDVKSTIRRMDGTEIYPTDVNDIHIGSASTGNGTLIFNNDDGDTKARVDMYSTAQADIEHMSAATSTWQYIGTPHNDVQIATYNYYDSWLYQYDTSSEGWVVIPNGGPLVPFRGYCVTHPQSGHTFEMYGKLVATTNVDLYIPAGKYVVVANSWVAPIDINAITADDMEGITDQTIYFFNTGSDTEGTGGTGTAAGTYRATPINAASYTGDWQIPSMQGFYVVGGSSNGTLHLDYNRHVRPTGDRTIVSNPMYAPRRAGMSDEPEVAKLFFRGHRYYDKLVVLEREDFTRGYDSGWDGEAWGGNDAAPMAYVTGEGRYDAVSAIPEYEGTVVGFRAGEDAEYLIDFEYSEDNAPLYLYDTETKMYARVLTGNTYRFFTSDKDYHNRFIFTRTNGQETPTGVDNVQGDKGQSTKAQKLLINNKMYILLNGTLYDATGKVVK